MVKEDLLRDLYNRRGYDKKASDDAVGYVVDMANFLISMNKTFENSRPGEIEAYMQVLIKKKINTLPVILALARYFYLIDNHSGYIYFTKILGGLGVIDNIKKRLRSHTDEATLDFIFKDLEEPPLGSRPSEKPDFTANLMERLKAHLEPDVYKKVLAGNNHGIPKEAMYSEKEEYENRQRKCDLGYLRTIYKTDNGSFGYRCPAEPIDHFVKKGGKVEETADRKCLCNALLANIELPQTQKNGYIEQMLITAGNDIKALGQLIKNVEFPYSAKDVINYLLSFMK